MDWALLESQLQSVYFEASTKSDRDHDARINSAYACAQVQDTLQLNDKIDTFEEVPLYSSHARIKSLIDEAQTLALALGKSIR